MIKTVLISLFLLASANAHAKPAECPLLDVAGDWKNPDNVTLTIIQSKCDTAELIDPRRDHHWKFNFNGVETTPPANFISPFPSSIGTMLKTVKMQTSIVPDGSGLKFTLTFLANLPAWSFNNTIDGLMTYNASVVATRNKAGKIINLTLNTNSIFLTEVNKDKVINGELSGFLQGSNVILNFFKRIITTNLTRD